MSSIIKRDLPTYNVTKSAIAEAMCMIDGKPVSFTDYPYQRDIYDINSDYLLLLTARQTGKSTAASNFMIAESISIPFFKTLYVAPTQEQTRKFSQTRLSKTIQYSPMIRERFRGVTDNVLTKMLANGSEIFLGYANDDPDRIRSITSDRIFLDEVQDMELQAILPVIAETMGNSNYAYEMYTGTPKSMENSIEYLWQQSTQTEWVMKCSGCSKYTFVINTKAMGRHGLICIKCGKAIKPREGFWHDMNPDNPDEPDPTRRVKIKGYHIPQPILPLNNEVPKRWERLLLKMEGPKRYSETKFKNEVLGVSDAIGSRLISLEELQAMCEDYRIEFPPPLHMLNFPMITGGVDWSGGGINHESRTVAWVWGLLPQSRGTEALKLKTLYYRIFPGRNAIEDVEGVCEIFNTFRCQMVCGDAGVGAVANSLMQKRLGVHRVYQLEYGALAKQIQFNGRDRWRIDKTTFMDNFMMLLKRKGVIFPHLNQMEEPIKDILNEFEEVTKSGEGRRVWRHAPTAPDDSLHAMLFGWVAMRILRGELSMYAADDSYEKR